MRMTWTIYTKDDILKMVENDKCKGDFWQLVSGSDIAYTIYVLKNKAAVW
jgi:hypothetical protein